MEFCQLAQPSMIGSFAMSGVAPMRGDPITNGVPSLRSGLSVIILALCCARIKRVHNRVFKKGPPCFPPSTMDLPPRAVARRERNRNRRKSVKSTTVAEPVFSAPLPRAALRTIAAVKAANPALPPPVPVKPSALRQEKQARTPAAPVEAEARKRPRAVSSSPPVPAPAPPVPSNPSSKPGFHSKPTSMSPLLQSFKRKLEVRLRVFLWSRCG